MKNKKYSIYTLSDGTKVKMEYNALLDKSDLKLKNGETSSFDFIQLYKETNQDIMKKLWG